MSKTICYFCLDGSSVINVWAAQAALYFRNNFLTEVMIYITGLGGPANLSMFALLIVLFLWLHKKIRHMIQFILTLSVGAFVIWLIKISVHLPRPEGGLVSASGYSFTSGHAAYAVIFFSLIVYSYKSHIKSRGLRRLFIAVNVLAALVVGMSRVYLGVHYFTDVLGGFLVGALISAISILIFEAYGRKVEVKTQADKREAA